MRGIVVALIVVALIVVAACQGQAPARLGSTPSWRSAPERVAQVGPVTFAPSSEPAARYNEVPPPVVPSPLGDAAIAAVRDAANAAGLPAPRADARLFRACSELAEAVLRHGMIGYPVIEFALQRNGIIEPAPELLIVWGDVTTPDPIMKELRPRLPGVLRDGATARLGIGSARGATDTSGVVVFALQASGVSTLPIPRAVATGGRATINAVIDPRYHDPEVFVTYEGGGTEQLDLDTKAGHPGGFVAELDCRSHSGREQVEITASDAAGATVLANFPVWCGSSPPLAVTVDAVRDDVPATVDEAERRLFASVNHDRAVAGLPALQWDEALGAVARAYSDEMRRTKLVAHISPTSGSAADRVRAANIRTAVVLENVARAYGVDEAHQALMNSPGHRANLMSSVATQIGIGVAFGDAASGRREMFITQVFTRVPPPFNLSQAVATVRRKLAAARPVPAVAPLDRLAQQLAEGVAAGKTADAAYQSIGGQVGLLGKVYQRVGSVITAVSDLDSVDGAALVGSAAGDEIGLGIAQGPHPQIGDNALWIVVLLADRRAQ